ncbi:ricin B-like lectin EULS3 [Cornus florida]|uniref:ricin B-like lectin EULS3 n=1 Tax=Cornus florida TaxID=4283 RepID=UPI00289B8E11|nr:ricin B-like lectin EULS3 [Cornus florida]
MDSTFGHHNSTSKHKNGRDEEYSRPTGYNEDEPLGGVTHKNHSSHGGGGGAKYSSPDSDYYDQSSSRPSGHGYSSAYSNQAKNHATGGYGSSSAYSDPSQGHAVSGGHGHSSAYPDHSEGHAASGGYGSQGHATSTGGHGYSSAYPDQSHGNAASGGHGSQGHAAGGHGYSSTYSDQPHGHAASGGHGHSSAYSDQPHGHAVSGDHGYSSAYPDQPHSHAASGGHGSHDHAASGGHGYSSTYSDQSHNHAASGHGYSSAYSDQPQGHAGGDGGHGYSSTYSNQPEDYASHHASHKSDHHASKSSSLHDTHSKGTNLTSKPTVQVFCKANTGYSLTIRNGEVILAPSNPSDEFQHWIKDEKYSSKVEDEEGFSSFVLINKATGEALKHASGDTKPVKLIPFDPDVYDETIVWTKSKDFGDGYKTIRMAKNIRLNVDAFQGDNGGVRDGTAIVLWEWKHGDNQLWKITPYGNWWEEFAASKLCFSSPPQTQGGDFEMERSQFRRSHRAQGARGDGGGMHPRSHLQKGALGGDKKRRDPSNWRGVLPQGE